MRCKQLAHELRKESTLLTPQRTPRLAAWTPDDRHEDLCQELVHRGISFTEVTRGLVLVEGTARPWWAEAVAPAIEIVEYSSISAAARILRERGGRWQNGSIKLHRRSQLILEQVMALRSKPFPNPARGSSPLESSPSSSHLRPSVFFLLSETQMALATEVWPPLNFEWAEDLEKPSRAYLKLWELFTFHFEPPQSRPCLELGASPGGWTAVLRDFGNEVWALDRAPLDPRLQKDAQVHFKSGNAFVARPEDFPQVEWIFSDLICTPDKLWEWLQPWLQHPGLKFVCTLKFKGRTDFGIIDQFQSVPGSSLLHLKANKHELTWVRGVTPKTATHFP